MPDKKYKELSKRLDAKNKNRRGGNFRTYEKIRRDSSGDSRRQAGKTSADAGRRNGGDQPNPGFDSFIRKIIMAAAPIIIVLALIFLGAYALTNKNATEISVNGEVIGHLKTTKLTKEEFLATLSSVIEQIEETKILISDEIELASVHGKSKLIKEEGQLVNLMADIVNYKVLAAEILVDGKSVGIAKSNGEAEKIFKAIQAPYLTNPESMTASFVQNVEAKENYYAKEEITPSDTIRAEMVRTVTNELEYVVADGDYLSKIAVMNGISVNDIKDMNTELDLDKPLQIGTTLKIISTAPFVSVMTIESSVETVPIQMDTTEQPDSSLPSGQKKIILQGKPGKKEIKSQIIRINDVITSKGEPTETIIEPMVTQIVSVGTQ